MYNARQFLNKTSLVNLYYSYVYPIELIVLKFEDVLIQPISNVCFFCKKYIRINIFSRYLAHLEPAFMSLEILPLEKIFYHSCGLMMYKYHNSLLP